MVPNKLTLTIEPGVTVNFQGSYKFYVQGRVVAIGTQTDSIVFTATDKIYGWGGFRFDHTPDTNDSSKFKYCKIQYGFAFGETPNDNGGAFFFSYYSKAIISNCLITNCKATNFGGGIYFQNSHLDITENKILKNTADWGGGIYCSNSNSKITGNTISYNNSNWAGGIYCENTIQEISRNIVTYNYAKNSGGGMYCHNDSLAISNNDISHNSGGGGITCSSGILKDNTISFNSSVGNGGGISCGGATVSNNMIFNNSAVSGYGGGIYGIGEISSNTIFNNEAIEGGGISFGNGSLNNNKIENNTAYRGGGISCGGENNTTVTNNKIINNLATYGGGISNEGNPTYSNNVISNNSAYEGGGIYCNSIFYTYNGASIPTFTNNTISFNDANLGGALYCYDHSDPVFYNSILWGNTSDSIRAQVVLNTDQCDPDFYYCDVQGGLEAFKLNDNFYIGFYENNMDADPMFVSPSDSTGVIHIGKASDWSLKSNSPCLNTGSPKGIYPTTDITGNPRVFGSTIDLGAYEFQDQGSSIEPLLRKTVFVYPNPAHDKVEISGIDNGALEIIDNRGQIVKTLKMLNTKTTVDISNLSGGVYLIKATTEKGILAEKIIKQ
jgi:hypothetical protein